MRNKFSFGCWSALFQSSVAAWVAIGLLLVCLKQPANGQALSAINGTVTDATGGVVANAKVTVTNNATQVSKT
ncbi:MAG: carboxypeptidase regulatory-like domain-containing protein, partial [Acidobacteriaceae bacterium]|nr:carboxypeptidase regulatory-like domain-containing protein [Acidobacteriaceae bacterium]